MRGAIGLASIENREEFAAWFWSQVAVDESGCWLWTGPVRPDGYGWVYVRLFRVGRRKMLAHQVAYILAKGILSPDRVLYRTCEERACCHPRHLIASRRVVVRREEISLMAAGEPYGRGETNPRARLTREDVLGLRVGREKGYSYRELASLYGVSVSTAYSVAKGKTWGHVG